MKMKQKKKILKSKGSKMKVHLKPKPNNNSGDITFLILRDHEPLKKLILTLKDSKIGVSKKQNAYKEFKQALTVHALAEEESLYVHMKEEDEGGDLRIEGFEGGTEHTIAKELIKDIDEMRTHDDQWMAKVKVLAEIVDHHLKEEEKEFIKRIRKEFSSVERIEIGKEYSRLLNQFRIDEYDEEEDVEQEKPAGSAEIWA